MGILAALQDFLETFDGMELAVETDRPGDGERACALAPVGSVRTGRDVSGRRSYQNSYLFCLRSRAESEAERAENWALLEALGGWLEEQDEQGNYPALPAPYRADGLEAGNAVLASLDEQGKGNYQVQIKLNFYKE